MTAKTIYGLIVPRVSNAQSINFMADLVGCSLEPKNILSFGSVSSNQTYNSPYHISFLSLSSFTLSLISPTSTQ